MLPLSLKMKSTKPPKPQARPRSAPDIDLNDDTIEFINLFGELAYEMLVP
jgi:hypothetical protein